MITARQPQRLQPKLNTLSRAAAYSSSAGGLSKDEVEARVLDVFKGFEKVDPTKVSMARSLAVNGPR